MDRMKIPDHNSGRIKKIINDDNGNYFVYDEDIGDYIPLKDYQKKIAEKLKKESN